MNLIKKMISGNTSTFHVNKIYNKDYKRGYAYLSIELLSWIYRENYISKSNINNLFYVFSLMYFIVIIN